MAPKAFDLADRFQTPVFVLTDLDIGMNDWMCPHLKWDDSYRPDKGRVLSAAELAAMDKFQRYSDSDADGVTSRTLPGVHAKGAYFTRGSGTTSSASTPRSRRVSGGRRSPDPQAQERRQARAGPDIRTMPGATIGIVTVGGCDQGVREGIELLAEQGIKANFMRVRGFPFGGNVEEFLRAHDVIYVVEQNRDAQLRTLLVNETGIDKERLRSVLAYGGFPLSAHHVVDGVKRQLTQQMGEAL